MLIANSVDPRGSSQGPSRVPCEALAVPTESATPSPSPQSHTPACVEENSLSLTVSPTQKKKKKKTPSESGGDAPPKKPRKDSAHSLGVGRILALYEEYEVPEGKRPPPKVAGQWLAAMGGNVESLLALLEDLARRCKLNEGGYVWACIKGEAQKATLVSDSKVYLRPLTQTDDRIEQEVWLAQNHEGFHVGLRKWQKLDGPWPCTPETWRVDQWGSVPRDLPPMAAQLEQVNLLNLLDAPLPKSEPSLFDGVAH